MVLASTKVSTIELIGSIYIGVGLISFTILSSLYLFERAEHKH